MEFISITPNKLSGTVNIPTSKSVAHRAIISAALSHGVSNISNISFSDDIIATANSVSTLGVNIQKVSNSFKIKGGLNNVNNPTLDCFESASTLRFLIPIALLAADSVVFTGKEGLGKRPLQPYFEIFNKQNIKYTNKGFPLHITGKLKPGIFELDGSVSSQFITGLLFTLPLLQGDSTIIVKGKLESRGYVNLTLDILKKFSVKISEEAQNIFTIKGNQTYTARDLSVEGDYSQGAFWIVGALLGGTIECMGLKDDSLQSDKEILDIVNNMGARIFNNNGNIIVNKSDTYGSVIDVSNCPDIAPILAVLGALSKGNTKIINAKRLRIKECDRLTAIVRELKTIGADIEGSEDSISIRGKQMLHGGNVSSWNDHRIAMALAIASIRCSNPVIINGYKSVNKSYPHFFNDFEMLGGNINERSMG